MHQLRQHENIQLGVDGPFECQKCSKRTGFSSRIDYLKHTLTCFYPEIYTCKSCSECYDNYAQYLFHIKYIHTPVVYMCAICTRKYRNIKDLLDHDQLIHAKTINYCEFCYEPQKSRHDLFEHYKSVHLFSETEALTKLTATTTTTGSASNSLINPQELTSNVSYPI